MPNPWVSHTPSESDARAAQAAPALVQFENSPARLSPQRGLTPPDQADQLPLRQVHPTETGWVVGAHGGSGESTLAALLGVPAAEHAWPVAGSKPLPAVLVARTNAHGLLRAQAALRHWAAGAPVDLVGLVVVADAPGRLPRPLRDLRRHVEAGAPRVWALPWVEAWRQGATPDRSVAAKALSEIDSLLRGEIHGRPAT